ncbi:MAG: hypothetical protein A3F68_04470 [Acidobacteria bacterium RIFCSPLOWO2_12_FULL_54_10]|nr:MAG: hypothetical protein A3F68_04470 [Acidobacteria bacterium RIFCSPLOWO2_12_FULL_54_10]
MAICFVCPQNAFSQQAITSATLSGSLEDSTGARIVGVNVSVTHLDKNQTWRTVSDNEGRFRFLYLPVGKYQFQASHHHFTPVIQEITLAVGQAADISIHLTVAGSFESVVVTSEAPVIETVRTQLSDTIVTRDIENLPLNGRNYLDLALLSPAVSRTNTGNNERFAETSAVPGTGISIAGQRNLNNGFVVDGLSANDDAADLAGTFFSQDVIREFQVVTSGGIAEFGRASSGTINILTQSGGNSWRGSAYSFLRNQRFDATNVFSQVDSTTKQRIKSPWTQTQYGVSLGGPLRRDRVFLFSNFEQERLNRASFITISPANAATLNSRLSQIGYSTNVVTGNYSTGQDRSNYFGKVDYTVTDNHRFSTRYSFYDVSSPNARGVGGLSTVSRGTLLDARDQTIAFSDVITLSATSVNEARFQFTRSRLAAPGNDLIGPAISISGVANFGAASGSPTGRDTDMIELANNYSQQSGDHFWKAGVNYLYNRINILFPGSLYGAYTFSNLPNFLSGNYLTFTQAFGKTDWFQTNPNLGWFLQDEWKPLESLTINAGLRHDVQWMVDPIETRGANFSPRLGVAYAPGDRKTVIRASFGLYYDRIPLRAVANGLRGAGIEYKTISIQRGQVGAPVFPSKLAAAPAGVLITLATMDPHIKNGSAMQSNLQIERELPAGTSVSLGYLRTRGYHTIMQRNLNVAACTTTVDPVNLCRPNPNYSNITQYSGQGDSHYNGMTLSVQNRSLAWTAVRFSYTFSKAIDNAGNFFFSSPQNNFNIRDDRGLSDNDQRHRLTLSGQVSVPLSGSNSLASKIVEGFQLSAIYTYGSPYPFNIVTGGQTLQLTTARPAGIGRNTGVGFNSSTLDLRLSRRFSITEKVGLEFLAESFNTLNRTNLQFPNNVFGAGITPLASFGKATNANDPRQIQLGLRLNF